MPSDAVMTAPRNRSTESVRRLLKCAIGCSLRFVPRVRRAVEEGLTVFTFHEVSDRPSRFAEEYGLSVSAETFRRQVSWIASNFNVMHPADILRDTPVPRRAAVISFDDGYMGTFENGLPVLEQVGVPAIIFLNMRAILQGKPILSAIACFLDLYSMPFAAFARSVGLSRPFHLTLTPSLLAEFEEHHGPVDCDAINEYQGRFADLGTIKAWDGKRLVAFGNHLFDHWNAAVLSAQELEEQYMKNEAALAVLKSRTSLFAFTNGQPKTCFSDRDVALIRRLGAAKVFSAAGGVNKDPRTKFVLGRLGLAGSDDDENAWWFRVGRAVLDRRTAAY